MRKSIYRRTSTYFLFYILFTVLILNSCSSDDSENPVADEENQEEMDSTDPTNDNQETETNPENTTVFEDNFVLDKSNKLINYILSEEEYTKFITRNGDFTTITKKIYEYLNDSFDFVFVLSTETEQPDG